MERLKQYSAAAVAAVLALIFLVVAVLAFTVFKPAQELSSSVNPDQSLVMTRDGVLPLVSSEVTVNATSASGAKVTLAVGTPGDVIGWIGADPYTEIVGLTSDRSVLKVEEHAGTVRVDAQSSAQSDAQSDAQSSAQSGEQDSDVVSDPEAARIVSEVTASDMWLDSAEGTGSASLSLTGISSGRSLIVASAAGSGDLTLTLTWPMQRTNTLAIVTVLLAVVSALLAVVLFLSRRQILRHRAERARKIAERKGADATDTQTIDTMKIAELVEAQRDEESSNDSADEEAVEPEDETPERVRTEDVSSDFPVDEASDGNDSASDDEPVDACEDDAPADEDSQDTDREDSRADEEDHQDVPADDADGSGTDDGAEGDEEAIPQVSGRHGEYMGTEDEDPPQKVPTDTGIIDLGAVRPGASLPSRRALREARERGEQTLIVDGREFDTGLIPVVSVDASPAEAQQAPDGKEEDTHEQTEQPESRAQTSAWTSIMSGWLKKRD